MSSPLPSNLLELTYRPDLDIIVGRWTQQPAADLLPHLYQQLAEAAVAHRSLFWLQDIRRRLFNDPATTSWLFTTYFPTTARRLGGRLHIAYLASPALVSHIQNSPSYLPPPAYAAEPFSVAFFSDEGPAVEWLHHQR